GRVDKSKSREIQNAKQRLDELEANLVERPTRRWQMNAYFQPEALTSQEVIKFNNLSKAYSGRTLFEALSLTITSGERVVLQGSNGIGKTTLLKLIMGLDAPDSGTIKVAGGARLGYLDQEQESLNPDQTAFEAFSQGIAGSEADHRETLFKIGLFSQH